MKPLIGLIPLLDAERDSLWMLPGYMEGMAALEILRAFLQACG